MRQQRGLLTCCGSQEIDSLLLASWCVCVRERERGRERERERFCRRKGTVIIIGQEKWSLNKLYDLGNSKIDLIFEKHHPKGSSIHSTNIYWVLAICIILNCEKTEGTNRALLRVHILVNQNKKYLGDKEGSLLERQKKVVPP